VYRCAFLTSRDSSEPGLSPARSGKPTPRAGDDPAPDQEGQSSAEQQCRRRLRYRCRYRIDAHVVDTQLKLEQIVGLGKAQTKCFSDVRRQECADVCRNGVVSAHQRIPHFCLVEISEHVSSGDAERICGALEDIDPRLLVQSGRAEIQRKRRGEPIRAVTNEEREAQRRGVRRRHEVLVEDVRSRPRRVGHCRLRPFRRCRHGVAVDRAHSSGLAEEGAFAAELVSLRPGGQSGLEAAIRDDRNRVHRRCGSQTKHESSDG
jgi:hypothetical protein